MIIRKLSLLLFMSLMLACSSSQKLLDKKNYHQSYHKALRELKKNKASDESHRVLIASLDSIIINNQYRIDNLLESDELSSFERALEINRNTLRKIHNSSPFTDSYFDLDYARFKSMEKQLSHELSQAYFSIGQNQLEEAVITKNKMLAKDAYYNLRRSENYGFDEPILSELLDESHQLAQVQYLIKVSAPFEVSYHWDIDQVFDNVENLNDEFTTFTYGNGLFLNKIDAEIEITFGSLDISYSEECDKYVYKKEVIKEYKKARNSEGQEVEEPVYEEIEGIVIQKISLKTATWQVRVTSSSKDFYNHLSDRSFSEQVSSEALETILEGDKRAIPSQYLCTTTVQHISDDDMAEELIESLYNQFKWYYL